MSKIICDVCGTSYQESAAQCPICGCARPIDEIHSVESDENKIVKPENYTYVKGGRFSKTNVQKRLSGTMPADDSVTRKTDRPTKNKVNKGDRGLVIAVCALLLAIIAVVIYIAVHFFAVSDGGNEIQQPIPETTTQHVETEDPTVNSTVICTGIVLSQTEVKLTAEGEAYTLDVILTPADTTDELRFETSDDTVVIVSDGGDITAVAAGDAIITVTCGEASAQCHVVCEFIEEVTEAETEPVVENVIYKAPYKISKKDVSISVGETFQLKLTDASGEIIPVVWSPAVEDICSVDGNAITGVAKGKVEMSTTYNGETYTCIIRVR